MEIFTPGLVSIFAVGFADDPKIFNSTVDMLRITLPYILFISLVAFSGGIFQTRFEIVITQRKVMAKSTLVQS